MTEVYIVYAHFPDGPSTAMKAFSTRASANRYIEKVTRSMTDGHGYELMSAAEMLGIAALTIVTLPVEGHE